MGLLISTLRRSLLQLWCSLPSSAPIILLLLPVFFILWYFEQGFSPTFEWISLFFTVLATSKVINKKLNPQWNRTLKFPKDEKVLELHVKDHNVLLRTTNIDHCIVEYKDVLPNQTSDTWLRLRGVKTGEVHVQVARRLHAPQEAPIRQPVNSKSLLKNTSLKISSCLKEAFQLVEDGETGQLREKIAEIELLVNDQEARILQVIREKEMLLSKISELDRVMGGVK
ncbi:hypothetical protein L7F22_059333 [Adiantum nelumboides]|nr:hypothetical protein [Adiantum nelumboides]